MFKTTSHIYTLILFFLLLGNGLWAQDYIQEEVKLHIDKELYIAGETIWGKVYVLDALFGKPSQLSQVVFVEFWDTKGNLVVQNKVLLNKSSGEISLQIPTSSSSGFYQIRAYTKWMANASSEDFASLTLRVFNPEMPIPLSDETELSPGNNKEVQVFPEGGNFIDGLSSRVGVVIKDQQGRPASSIGRIEQTDGTVVAVFESNAQGLGEFTLSPEANKTYGLRLIQNGDSSQLLALPPTATAGISLAASQESEFLKVETHRQNLNGMSLTLKLSKGGYPVYSKELGQEPGKQTTNMLTSDFPPGKYLIHIETNKDSLMAWRYVWIGKTEPLNLKLSVSTSIAQTREKVRVDIQTLDARGNPSSADLALSIGKSILGQKALVQKTYTELDLLTHMAPISHAGAQTFIHPDIFGLSISGRIKNLSTNLDSSARVIFTLPGKTPYMRTVKTNDQGNFNIALENIFGIREIGLLAVGLEGTVLDIELDPVFYGKTPYPSFQKLRFSKEELTYLNELYIQNQLQLAYQDTFPSFLVRKTPPLKSFFQYPDKDYILDEYTRFDTEETFNEIVYSISLRKKKGVFGFRAYNQVSGYLMKPPPLILFDGIPLTDANELLKINSKLIERIQVVSSIYYQDNFPIYGIINVTSFKGDGSVLNLPPKYIRKPFSFLDAGRTFVKVSHEGEKLKRIPDQRNLLHWEPRIQTDAQGKAFVEFYTSDISGPFEIKASALSSEGLWAEEKITFEVVAGEKR